MRMHSSMPRLTDSRTTRSRRLHADVEMILNWIWYCATTSRPGSILWVSIIHMQKLHHIKKENIGLIEVMGLAVLPARLKDEMAELADALVNGTDLRATETLASHAEWAEGFLPKYDKITKDNVMDICMRKSVWSLMKYCRMQVCVQVYTGRT